jgi:hypothetical protein
MGGQMFDEEETMLVSPKPKLLNGAVVPLVVVYLVSADL